MDDLRRRPRPSGRAPAGRRDAGSSHLGVHPCGSAVAGVALLPTRPRCPCIGQSQPPLRPTRRSRRMCPGHVRRLPGSQGARARPLHHLYLRTPMSGTTTAEWLTAGGTILLGLLGISVSGWQFWAQGFRPKAVARIEPARERVMVSIRNQGRSEGLILAVGICDDDGVEIEPAPWTSGFYGGIFQPTYLPGNSEMRVKIVSPRPLPSRIWVIVDSGKKRPSIRAEQVGVSFAEEATILPPGA